MALVTSSSDHSPLQEQGKNVSDQPETAERDQITLSWQLLLTFGIMSFLVSLSLNICLWNQNRILRSQQQQFDRQAMHFRQNEEMARALIRDVVYYSNQYPDVRTVLVKHGIPVSSLPVISPPIPTPLQKPQQAQQSTSKKKP